MSDPTGWLDGRDPAPPPGLRAAMDALLAGEGGGPLPDRLAGAGLRGLAGVVGRPSERRDAVPLLAADALLTYACEAAAEAGPDEVGRLTARLDLRRFERLLPHSQGPTGAGGPPGTASGAGPGINRLPGTGSP